MFHRASISCLSEATTREHSRGFFSFFFYVHFSCRSEKNRTFYRMEIARIETETKYVCVCVCARFSRTLVFFFFFFKSIGFLLIFLLRVSGEEGYEEIE